MPRVGDIAGWLAERYPPALAEEWDRVGLSVGDPDAQVTRVLFAVDVTDAVVAEAVAFGAELIVSHHPLLLRGVHAVRTDQPKGRVVTALIHAGIAVCSAHTNADSALDGVSDALADTLGLLDRQPLVPQPEPPLDKVVTFVPPDRTDAVVDALATAGAGAIGAYEACAFRSEGVGQFRPLPGAQPYLGTVGALETTPEIRIEMVLPRGRRDEVVAALLRAHPYETPAYDVLELASASSAQGLGRVGRLPVTLSADEVAGRLADALPATAAGVLLGGDPRRRVESVAVLGGAGDSLLDAARAAGVDCYVTSDLRHHPAQDFLAHQGSPVLVDTSHWASEWLWLPRVEAYVRERASGVASLGTAVSRIVTDPWVRRYGA